jgi:hypothetical protein
MWLRNLVKSLTATSTRQPTHRSLRASRLRVEPLEGRWVPSFSPAASYPIGVGPQAVVSGDFNTDTRPDLAVVNSDGTVSVLLGNADGTFQPARNFATGAAATSIAAGDFNADGKLDLVTADPGEAIYVLLGNGNGTFQSPIRYVIDTNPQSVAVGDFNGDGKLDLGVLSNWPGEITDSYANVLLGTGSGAFSAPHSTWIGEGFHYAAAVADFNGDNKLDFAASSELGNVDVAFGSGTGTFSYPATFPFAFEGPGVSLITGDLNNDGKADLATVFSNWAGTRVGVLLGNGLGSFGPVQTSAADSLYGSLAEADFNGDGNTDLIVASSGTGTIGVMLGTGTGAFRPPVTASAGSYLGGVAVGDFNGDGRPDAATTNVNSNTVSVLLNDGNWPPVTNPSLAIDDVTVTEGNTGTVSATFTVSLSAASNQTVSVDYATTDGTATAGDDYQETNGSLTFAPGEMVKTITVPVNGDRLAEANETFSVRLGGATNAFIADSTGEGTILDDEPTVSIIDAVSSAEGNAGMTAFTFTVTLSDVYDAPVTVAYATADLTNDEEFYYGVTGATAGIDYQATSGTLTIPAGQTSGTITVLVNGDQVVESDESFFVNLSNPTGAGLGTSQAMPTILNDDVPPPSASINDVAVAEGNTGSRAATFTLTLSATSPQPVTIDYATADGTATAGSDYQAASGTLTFAPGETSKTITVPVMGDRLAEPNETFVVNLSSPTNATIADGQGVGTILDDEPRISISDVTKAEGKRNQTTQFTFTVTLSAAYDQAVTMSFRTVDGTARTSDSDYVARTGTLTFAPGETTKTVTIVVNGDSKREADETFYLDLFGNSSNSLVSKNRGTGTIANDD